MENYNNIYDHDNGLVLKYAGTNNGSIYYFNEYEIDADGELIPTGERRLVRSEIRKHDGGDQLLKRIDADADTDE